MDIDKSALNDSIARATRITSECDNFADALTDAIADFVDARLAAALQSNRGERSDADDSVRRADVEPDAIADPPGWPGRNIKSYPDSTFANHDAIVAASRVNAGPIVISNEQYRDATAAVERNLITVGGAGWDRSKAIVNAVLDAIGAKRFGDDAIAQADAIADECAERLAD